MAIGEADGWQRADTELTPSPNDRGSRFWAGLLRHEGGYVYRPSRHEMPVLLSEEEAGTVADAYAGSWRRAIGWSALILCGGVAALILRARSGHGPVREWSFLLASMAAVIPVTIIPRAAVRRAAAQLGPRRTVVRPGVYEALRRERLRDTSWLSVALPAIPAVFAKDWRATLPPRSGDGWASLAIVAFTIGATLWAAFMKWRAHAEP